MQLEELLAALQGAQPQQDDRFQVIPHESGNTVIADSRSASERPGFWGTPEGKALMADGRNLSIQSAQEGLSRYNSNYTQSLLQPFREGPLPNYEKLKDDPKWWELYSTNQQLADQVYGRVHGKSFTQAIQEQKEIGDVSKKTIQGMIAKREIFQGPDGEWKQLIQEPDELGQMKNKIAPASMEVLSMLRNAGGPEGVGVINAKQLMSQRQPAQPTPAPTSLQNEEPQPGAPETFKPMFGLGDTGRSVMKDARVEGLSDMSVENPDRAPTLLRNLMKRFTGGVGEPVPDPREANVPDMEWLMINTLRARKGLPTLSQEQYQLYKLRKTGGKALLQ